MKKRIQWSFFGVIVLTTVFVVLASVYYISGYKLKDTRKSLGDNMRILAEFIQDDQPEGDWETIGKRITRSVQKEIRITMLDDMGVVVYDSQAKASVMENHSQRKEFQEAKKSGYGEDIRTSRTTGEQSIYTCRLLKTGCYIRMAMPVNAVNQYIYTVLPPILGFCFVLMCVAAIAAASLSKRFTRPYKELSESLDCLISGTAHGLQLRADLEDPEIAPIVENIRELDKKLQTYVQDIQEKSRSIENIISAVGDGIIVLNRSQEVLTINPMANHLFPTQGNFQTSCRNQTLLEKINETIETGTPTFLSTEILSCPGKMFRCLVSPASETTDGKEQVAGVVITISDITEIKKLENMRSEFISNFSHEMKSPLTSIKGFAELLKNNMVSDPEKIKSYLHIIITESTRLVNLINDMLKLSEIEGQKKKNLIIDWVDLREVVDNTRNLLTFQADAKNITFLVEGEACIYSDNGKLSEIMLNIMDNAIKYNKMDGHIAIKIWQDEESVSVSVWDNGVGISKENIERVFERFYRVDKARSRKSGSTGLGLSIVKHDIELLGGKITAESEEDSYTRMTVIFQK